MDINTKDEKNKLISFPSTKSLIIIDLNDPKHTYLEQIELNNYTYNDGAKSANILYESIY
jgi:hypothetical protein